MSKELSKNVSYCEQTISLRLTLEEGFLALGERLHNILEKKLYEGRWDSWGDYLEDLRIDKTAASKLIRIYQVFVLEYKLSKKSIALVGREIAYDLTRVVKNKNDAQEWLGKGESLRLEDVRIALKEQKNGVTQADCRHNWVTIRYCNQCGIKEILNV